MKIFFSFCFDKKEVTQGTNPLSDEQFVHRICYFLSKQADMEICCWNEARDQKIWDETIITQLATCDKFVFFRSEEKGSTQKRELELWKEAHESNYIACTAFVNLTVSQTMIDKMVKDVMPMAIYNVQAKRPLNEASAIKCAWDIFRNLKDIEEGTDKKEAGWIEPDGLPIGYPFAYEKAIIEEFARGKGRGRLISAKRLQEGCPIEWPEVDNIRETIKECRAKEKLRKPWPNPIPESEIGRYRNDDERIIVDVRSRYHQPHSKDKKECCCLMDPNLELTLREAGPRSELCYPMSDELRIGIVVSGGIAPGINAVIAGVCQRHRMYKEKQKAKLKVRLYRDGFSGVLAGNYYDLKEGTDISDWAKQGGSVIGTSRHDVLLDSEDRAKRQGQLDEIIDMLCVNNQSRLDILYVIGGEGSMRAAHALWNLTHQRLRSGDRRIRRPVSIIAIPKTMDNDVLWVWQTFGFLSAVEKAKELIANIGTEAKSNPRLCIMQLFGSDSGFVVSHAALASGVCKAALIPEVDFDMTNLSDDIRERLQDEYDARELHNNQSPYGIILLAETAIPLDVEDYIDNPQYPDLHLHSDEKRAIRAYIGSPLLSRQDIIEDIIEQDIIEAKWLDFCETLCSLFPRKKRSDEILMMADLYTKIKTGQKTDIQELIITALNSLIQEGNLPGIIPMPDDHEPAEKVHILEDCLKKVKMWSVKMSKPKTSKDAIVTCQRLRAYALSSRAKGVLRALETHLSPERFNKFPDKKIWLTLFHDHSRELHNELTKLHGRLYLETLFSGYIKPLSVQEDRRVYGQTPDELRSGGIKVVAGVLKSDIQTKMEKNEEFWEFFRVFVNEPRHLIRAISPSVSDIISGQRLGMLAVDNAMAGYTDFMISQWLTEYVLVPLELVVLGRKRVPQEGIFWKSVRGVTGQAAQMKWGGRPESGR